MKIPCILFLSCLCLSTLFAQEKGTYFSFAAGTGAHSLNYELAQGHVQAGQGALVEFEVGHLFAPFWGVQTGMGFLNSKTVPTIDLMTTAPAIDEEGDPYELRTYFRKLSESQTSTSMIIPLNLVFRTPFKRKFQLNLALGAEVMLPLSTSYRVQSGEIETTGYYSQWNVEIANAPRHGWQSLTDHFSGTYSMNPCLLLIGGLKGCYLVSKNLECFVEGYFQNGLNNVLEPHNAELYTAGHYRGLLNSDRVPRATPHTIGLKVGLQFYLHPMIVQVE